MSRKIQTQSLVAVTACILLASTAFADPVPVNPAPGPSADALSLIYNPGSGNLSATAPAGSPLTALEVRSDSRSFSPPCNGLDGIFDICESDKVFRLTTDGFMEIDYGNILPLGWTSDQLVGDLTVDGATLGGGFDVGTGPTVSVVPEPAAVALLGIGGLALGVVRRRRRLAA